MDTAAAALAGVFVGGVLSMAKDVLQRRWQRAEKARERGLERGEELLRKCQEMFEWSEAARRAGFEGNPYIPVQSPLFRIAAIIELYYPALGTLSGELDARTREYRSLLVDIAAAKMRADAGRETETIGATLEQFNQSIVHFGGAMTRLHTSARNAVRDRIQ